MPFSLNYAENLLTWVSAITGCISISASVSLVGISLGIASSAIGLKLCVITPGFKNIVMLAKDKLKLHNTKVLLSKNLVSSFSRFDEFVSVNNILKEYDNIKEVTKNPKSFNWDNEFAWYNQSFKKIKN